MVRAKLSLWAAAASPHCARWWGFVCLWRSPIAIACALLAMVFRLAPSVQAAVVGSLQGRPDDIALVLAAVLLLAALRWTSVAPAPVLAGRAAALPQLGPIQALLDTHLELDNEIDKKLQEVVVDTESSAIAIIGQVRQLHDSSNTLAQYLDKTNPQANTLGEDIVASMTYLVQIGAFIEELPAKLTRDLNAVQGVVQELTELSSLVGSVRAISMQSHLLSINAAIEGSRAGPGGAAFRVVAEEMRLLASNSSNVALKIGKGLERARAVVEAGMATRVAESSKAQSDVSQAVVSIRKLQENFEDMSQYFKTRFAVITQHNQNLTADIAAVLGHIQYQDVVKQCIDRMRNTTSQRNALLEEALAQMKQDGSEAAQLPQLLAQILANFVEEEQKHKHSARHDEQASGELKFELF